MALCIGPCINAGGRLEDPQKERCDFWRGLQYKRDADILAGELKALNDNRKDMTEKAVELAAGSGRRIVSGRSGACIISSRDCHESLAGIP